MIKLFHYDIYEYELLQNELNKLARQGYTTNKVSKLTFFKKTEKPVYFLVDIFTSNEKSLNKKREEKSRYIDYYLENDYELISSFKNILVFKGNQKLKPRKVQQQISQSAKVKRLLQFFLSLFFLCMIYMFFIVPLQPYHLLTNGKILFYISLMLIAMLLCYRCFLRWTGIYQLSRSLSHNEKLTFKNMKLHYYLSSILSVICILLILLSFALDIFDTQTLKTLPQGMPTLTDYHIDEESELSIQTRSSFVVPQSYEYVQYTKNQEKSLYVLVYEFNSKELAQNTFDEMLKNPNDLYVDKYEKIDEQHYLGLSDNKAYLEITIENQKVTLINTNFEINKTAVK